MIKRLDSGSIAYLDRGESDAQLIVCLHGFPDIPRTWHALTETLVDRGYRVAAPYLRGYHPSTLDGPFDVPALVEDLRRLIDRLSPERRVHLIGHDWGAVVAYLAMQRFPERVLRAVTMAVPHLGAVRSRITRVPTQFRNSWYMAFFQLPIASDAIVCRRDFEFIDRLWAAWSPGYVMPEDYRAELKDCLRKSMPKPLHMYRAIKHRANVTALQSGLEPIDVPTLYVHGARDGCISKAFASDQSQYFTADHQTLIVERAGHFVHLEQPEAVADAVVDWFAR